MILTISSSPPIPIPYPPFCQRETLLALNFATRGSRLTIIGIYVGQAVISDLGGERITAEYAEGQKGF